MDDLHSHFFFSSRRRHTRWPRDWSSDVCSSDLYQHLERMPFSSTPDLYHCEGGLCALMQQEELRHLVAHHYGAVASPYERSEERRVGKECRTRRAQEGERREEKQKRDENGGRCS